MEVRMISRELVRPSSPEIIRTKPPQKLCLFDQLTPLTFSPLIIFYHNPHCHNPNIAAAATTSFIHRLKSSLAETLNIYYPFSGRTNPGNLVVDRFEEGVPFLHAQSDCRLSDFLKSRQPDLLNRLLPRPPYHKEPADVDAPLLEIQVSVFTCGGIALGWAASHKLIDGFTMRSLIHVYSSISLGGRARDKILAAPRPNFGRAAELFPAREDIPESYRTVMEKIWFTEGNYVTRRFVFDSKSISKLRALASSGGGKTEQKQGRKPIKLSRVEAVSCFIWKSNMSAAKFVSGGTPRTSVLVEAVNLRGMTDPPLYGDSIGNVVWWATAWADESSAGELPELAELLSGAIELYKSDYVRSLQGEEGFEAMSNYFDQLEGLLLEGEVRPDILAFTSWNSFGETNQDFGWGGPVWVAAMGRPSPGFRNFTVLVDSVEGGGKMEAWITLEEKRMAVFERDPEFLAFASPNPIISSL
ncbi:unnamed protein product [Linum trigynum]|uniref:Uncharacterized protein n=1 Tax=Linum trigynum TaxID=586398 RepID=A0AAV2DLN4_9ROSI